MHFVIDYAVAIPLLIVLVLFACAYRATLPRLLPSLSFSSLRTLPTSSWKVRGEVYRKHLHRIVLFLLALALLDPHFRTSRSSLGAANQKASFPVEGLAIYLVLDQSGSMKEEVHVAGGETKEENTSKIELLKQVTEQFIKNHRADLMGIVSFARVPKVVAPLTLEQSTLLTELHRLQVAATPDEDGTAMGYAIYKTGHLIAATRHFAEEEQLKGGVPPYTIKNAVIVLVTDGFQDPNDLDRGNRLRTLELDEAAKYLQKEKIHLYIINIDPQFASIAYAPHRRQLKEITDSTGGGFYMANDRQQLREIYQDIDRLEKGTVLVPIKKGSEKGDNFVRGFSFYPFLLGAALALFFLALVLEYFILKKIP